MGSRCATRSYLRLVSKERKWTGRPSTTQLIQGTMAAFLKIVKEYSLSPDDRAFMINGTKGHGVLEGSEDELSLLEQKFDGPEETITGITDVIEDEAKRLILADYKVSGSYKVAKALGFYTKEEPTGEVYKSGKKQGEPKMRKLLVRSEEKEDRFEWELQLNLYRIKVEKRLGRKIDELRIQVCVRDGGTYMAHSRGVFRKIYYFKIAILPDKEVLAYFERKREALLSALKAYEESGKMWDTVCDGKENWDGVKCASYCEVAEFCALGKYLKVEKRTEEEMAIKGVSDVRRLPRLGKIRLGIKKKTAAGKEYPAEVDYFILDPETAVDLENEKLVQEFEQRYGKDPKQIPIMIPGADLDLVFPQWYKRYGSSSGLECRGDGEVAIVTQPEFAARLTVIGKTDDGLTKVECKGEACPYFIEKKCGRRATLQVLLPEMPGAGVWQINTGSWNSIVNINSCLDYIRAVAGRYHMIPLTLERRPQEVNSDGNRRTHYIMHISMTQSLKELQQLALIAPERITLELPEPAEDEKDILHGENANIDKDDKPNAAKPESGTDTTPNAAAPAASTAPGQGVSQQASSDVVTRMAPAGYDIIVAKQDGLCKSKACGKEYKKGQEVIFSKMNGIRHFDCA